MRIGFVGAGRMGLPMIQRLVSAGHQVSALGRNAETRKALGESGVRAVPFAAATGTDAEAVLVCVFTDEQVRAVCLDTPLLETMPPGSVLVVHTTGSPATVEAIAAVANSREIEVLDVPVSGGPHDIAAGQLTLFGGGDAAALERVRPALAAYGDPILHLGPLGSGQRVKLVNNVLFAAQIGLVAESVRLATQLGVTEAALLSALPHASSSGRALNSVAGKGSVAAFAESVGEFLRKDVSVARQLAAELNADLGPLAAAIDAGVDGNSGG
ncbi:NAD(P)-dependent oxidoreductase [Nocardia macrotermitis]|uniref:2-hydroxy-3-oxopropionate reductase n=1 Tax=Nocardia macrotermitis TaxID=2585198 RepID=A0A7K0CZ72_9NOCA|nr:NAD(P)-dependent oxidoreductase [Nocardia macrotermitis]MQY18773.1 2-hydroxy-3-oxopropionate reductase [Nocardia macrotermitis]